MPEFFWFVLASLALPALACCGSSPKTRWQFPLLAAVALAIKVICFPDALHNPLVAFFPVLVVWAVLEQEYRQRYARNRIHLTSPWLFVLLCWLITAVIFILGLNPEPEQQEQSQFFVCMIAMLLTITCYRLQREGDLQRKYALSVEQKQNQMFFQTHSIQLWIDPQSSLIQEANPAAERFYGYSRHELIGMSITRINRLSRDAVLKAMQKVTESEQTYIFEHQLKDGRLRTVQVCSGPVCFGEKVLLHSIVHDITPGVEARNALASQLRFSQQLLDVMPAMVYYRKAGGQFLGANAAFLSFFGLSQETLGRVNVRELFPEEVESQADPCRFEAVFEDAEGHHRDLLVQKVHRKGPQDEETEVGILVDISEKNQARKDLEAANEVTINSLREARLANQARSEFLSNMSHEVRTPMNAVIGIAQLLQASELNPQQTQYLQTLLEHSEVVLNLFNDVLELSTLDAEKLTLKEETLQIRVWVEGLVHTIAEKAFAQKLDLSCAVAPEVPRKIVIDSTRLQQVLMLLIGNALKFTSDGEVHLSLAWRSESVDCKLICEVWDTGMGIEDSRKEQIYDPFFQVDASSTREFGGTGLGLAIVRKALECMRGSISHRNWKEDGTGSVFRIEIPVQPPVEGFESFQFPCGGVQTVCLLNHQSLASDALQKALAQCGVQVARYSVMEPQTWPEEFTADWIFLDVGVQFHPDWDRLMCGLKSSHRIVTAAIPPGYQDSEIPEFVQLISRPLGPAALERILTKMEEGEETCRQTTGSAS